MSAPVKLTRAVEKPLEACTSTDLRRAADRAERDLKRIRRKLTVQYDRRKALEQAATLAVQHAFYLLLAERLSSLEVGYKGVMQVDPEHEDIDGRTTVAILPPKVIKALSVRASELVEKETLKFS